jgi:hypothetical protein
MGLDELVNMSWVIWKALLMQLALIETIHKELQGRFQCFWTARKTARAACQKSQIVAQFGVVGFDRISIGFALGNFIHTPVIPQAIIGIKGVAVIALGLRRFIHHLLDGCLCSLPDDLKAQIAAGKPIYDRDDEDLVFLSPKKVNSSSISASLTWAGTGGSGNLSAWAWTHRETVRW